MVYFSTIVNVIFVTFVKRFKRNEDFLNILFFEMTDRINEESVGHYRLDTMRKCLTFPNVESLPSGPRGKIFDKR